MKINHERVDYQTILDEVNQFIAQYGAWRDTAHSRVGSTLTQLLAALASYNTAGLMAAQRENFLSTARRASSIYAAADFLGVRLSRKQPASVQVTLTRTGDAQQQLVVPAYSQWSVDNQPFFNRKPIIFPQGITQLTMTERIYLHEGLLQSRDLPVDRLPGFRRLTVPSEPWAVSDQDVVLTVNGEQWARTDEALWQHKPQDKVFQDRTDSRGQLQIVLGNGQHGAYVAQTDKVKVVYVVTKGANAQVGNPPLPVTASEYPQIRGLTIGPAQGQANEKDPEFYRFMAPYVHRTQNRAVTPKEHVAIALQWPGVADALAQGQRHINPHDIRLMNTMRLVLLPEYGAALPADQKRQFLEWFKHRSWANLEIDLTVDPVAHPIDVVVTCFCYSHANLQQVKNEVEDRIRKLFARSPGLLGRTLSVSDLMGCRTEDVDYMVVNSPQQDYIPQANHHYAELGHLVVNVQYGTRNRGGANL